MTSLYRYIGGKPLAVNTICHNHQAAFTRFAKVDILLSTTYTVTQSLVRHHSHTADNRHSIVDFQLELYFISNGLAAFVSLLSSKCLHHGSRLGDRLCGVDSYVCGYSCSAEEETYPMPAVCLGFYFPQPAR